MLNRRRAVGIVGLIIAAATGCGGDAVSRSERVAAWARDPTPRNVRRLRSALRDSSGQVRALAVRSLASLGVSDAKEVARRALADPDAVVRCAAARAAQGSGDSEAAPDLARLVAGDPDWQVRRAAAEALGDVGDEAVTADLVRALDDPSEAVRLGAAAALARIGSSAAVEPLSRLAVDDASWTTRVSAVQALGTAGVPQAYVPLRAALSDPNEFVRAAAAEALRALSARKVPEPEAVSEILIYGPAAPPPEAKAPAPAAVRGR